MNHAKKLMDATFKALDGGKRRLFDQCTKCGEWGHAGQCSCHKKPKLEIPQSIISFPPRRDSTAGEPWNGFA